LGGIKDVIIYDSGCAVTIFNDRKWFSKMKKLAQPFGSLSASGEVVESHVGGVVNFEVKLPQGNSVTMELGEAIYQPSSPCNLIAANDLKARGVFWDQRHDVIYHGESGAVLMQLYNFNGVPAVKNAKPVPTNSAVVPTFVKVPYRKMHRRLLHASKATIEEACRRADIKITHKDDDFCEGCIMGKMTDELGKEAPIQGTEPLDFIRIDTVSHSPPAMLGYKYSVHIIDVATTYHWVKYARTKQECFTVLKDWVEMMHRQTGRWVKIIGVDGGTEFGQSSKPFSDDAFKAWCRSKGTTVMQTTPHTPWMNGKIERAARDVLDKTRATMISLGVPDHLWTFVMETVIQVKNVLPTSGNPGRKSPHELFARGVNMPEPACKPYIAHFRAYFCEAYYFIKPQKRVQSEKLAPRAEKGRLIGYADLHGKIFWIWNEKTGRVVRASAVKFNEGNPAVREEDALDPAVEYEVLFTDTSTEEERGAIQHWVTVTQPDKTVKTVTIREPVRDPEPREEEGPHHEESTVEKSHRQQGPLPTPEPSPEPEGNRENDNPQWDGDDVPVEPSTGSDSVPVEPSTGSDSVPVEPSTGSDTESQYDDAEEYSVLEEEAPIPPDNPMVPGMEDILRDQQEEEQPTEPVGGSGRPRRAKAKYGDASQPGYYRKLNEGKLPGQSFFAGHLGEPAPPPPTITMTMTSMKAEHDIARVQNPAIPKNWRQASKLSNYSEYWLPAMKVQDDSLTERKVYDLVPKRRGMTILPTKWVFDQKTDPTTGITTARARWVVCGNFDQGTWNSHDLYAAVVNSVTVRVFFALVAVMDLECEQFDFKTAFLNADIPADEEYYVEPPPGLDKPPGMVCKLKKALYGLRQSPLYWFKTIKPVMEDMGFEPIESDICLFRHKELGILVVLYVDDLLVAAETKRLVHRTRDQLRQRFELKDLGEAKRFLGYDILRDRDARKIFISQESYITALLEKKGMADCQPVTTPWPSKFELPTQWSPLMADQKAYIKDTGSINWVSCGTRPDIAYTVSRLAEANAGPSKEHLDLMKHLYRYLKGTKSYGIELGGHFAPNDMNLMAFGDASLADRLPTRHSTGGHVVFVAGGPVQWKTKKQTFVALSTTEAEFTNLTPTALSAKWVAKILEDCGAKQPLPTVLFTDSLNAYTTALNPLNKARTRAIDIRYKWVIEQVATKKIDIRHIDGVEMPADGLTKPLQREKHARFVTQLGMTSRKIPWAQEASV
jgi:hypothetical protein